MALFHDKKKELYHTDRLDHHYVLNGITLHPLSVLHFTVQSQHLQYVIAMHQCPIALPENIYIPMPSVSNNPYSGYPREEEEKKLGKGVGRGTYTLE